MHAGIISIGNRIPCFSECESLPQGHHGPVQRTGARIMPAMEFQRRQHGVNAMRHQSLKGKRHLGWLHASIARSDRLPPAKRVSPSTSLAIPFAMENKRPAWRRLKSETPQ
jgi:hypothetical protein